jgi:hypothetical protein
MTCKGTIRGKTIELEEPLPFQEGQVVTLSVCPLEQDLPGSPAALLKAVKAPPHVDSSIVDELERAIEESKIPVRYEGVFDAELDQ